MDDFKIWLYLIIGAIYIISRALKKKEPEKMPPKSPLETEDTQSRRKTPSSFEELLREISQEQGAAQDQTRAETEEEERSETAAPVYYQTQQDTKRKEARIQEEIKLEGEKRHFADDESRAIYERSIKEAEGADITYERDVHFKMKGVQKGDAKKNPFASDLKQMLQSPSSAKKAVVLAEILNRKYWSDRKGVETHQSLLLGTGNTQ